MNKFPFYKQPDAKDCGPTCLRIIAKHYKKSNFFYLAIGEASILDKIKYKKQDFYKFLYTKIYIRLYNFLYKDLADCFLSLEKQKRWNPKSLNRVGKA